MSDCARCRRPLEEEGRFNVTYGGRAHWACQARAVWPPLGGVQQFEYNPMIALRKMAMKEAFAGDEAQAHIQALMAIVGGDFNLPRPRQERRDSLSSDWDRGVQQVALSPLQSSTPPLPPTTPRSVAHTTPSERKRRQHPTPTPKTTPSPLAKNARANEPDPITQASEQQQPTTSKKTDHQQPARKEGKPTANEATVTVTNQYAQPTTRPTTRKGSRSKPIELEVTNENTRREYDLQQAIKAVGGKTVIEDTHNLHRQTRFKGKHREVQFATVVDHDHKLTLEKWGDVLQQTLCIRCKKMTKRGRARPDSYRAWLCDYEDHDPIEMCFTCVPVVLRTPVMDS